MNKLCLVTAAIFCICILPSSQGGEWSLHAAMSTRPTTNFSSIIYKDEVQNDLKLSPSQIGMLSALMTNHITNADFVQAIRGEYREGLSDPSISVLEKKSAVSNKNRRLEAGIENYVQEKIGQILTKGQKQRLVQLVYQAIGPAVIVSSAEIASKLQITEDQKSEISRISSSYENTIQCFCQRLMQLQVYDVRQRSSIEIDKEIGAVSDIIESLERDLDFQLIKILTDSQRKQWYILIGKPLERGQR
jgi:hypothetical protein